MTGLTLLERSLAPVVAISPARGLQVARVTLTGLSHDIAYIHVPRPAYRVFSVHTLTADTFIGNR